MRLYCQRFWNEQQGQDLVEYALATGMVAVAAVAALPTLTDQVTYIFSKVSSLIANAMG